MTTGAASNGELRTRRAATPIAFAQAIVLAYRKYGADPSDALSAAQIPPDALQNPNARLTAAQFEALAGAAMRELDDEALGWFSRKLPWGTYGMLCRASLASATLGLALKRWCRHHRLLVTDVILDLSISNGTAALSIEERVDLGPFREFCLLTLFRYVLGYASWAIDSKISLSSVNFPFSAPAHCDVYPIMFLPLVGFDANRANISFDALYLDLPLRREESDMNRMLKRALPLTILPYRGDRLLVERVHQLLVSQEKGFPTAETISSELNISTRSLHRQLQREQTSLRYLKEKARLERAIASLSRTDEPIKRVSAAVGFSSEKSFSRAFRQWTDQTPSEYRTQSSHIKQNS